MILAAIIFFALAAVLGVIMLSYLLRDKHIPKGLAVLHGPLAVVGLVLLIIYTRSSSFLFLTFHQGAGGSCVDRSSSR